MVDEARRLEACQPAGNVALRVGPQTAFGEFLFDPRQRQPAAGGSQHLEKVRSLWPVTIIESQASINLGLGSRAQWRKPDILVDCVLRLVQKEPAALTGQVLPDEEFLRGEGGTDFAGYACLLGTDPPPLSWKAVSPA